MNADVVARLAFAALPPGLKGRGTVTHTDGRTLEGELVMANARGASSDSFRDRATTATKGRTVSFRPDATTFAPKEGMVLTVGETKWGILGVAPLAPDGETAPMYRLLVER